MKFLLHSQEYRNLEKKHQLKTYSENKLEKLQVCSFSWSYHVSEVVGQIFDTNLGKDWYQLGEMKLEHSSN